MPSVIGVCLVEVVPPVVTGVLAPDRTDGRPVQQELGDDQADVPAGGHLGQPLAVLDRVLQGEPGPPLGGCQLPP